jgi:hypothetical protein
MNNGNPYQQNWFNNGGMQCTPQPQSQQPVVLNNFLTPEIVANLQRNPSFVVKLTPDEYNKGICTHKFNNSLSLQHGPDGKYHCTTCTEDFNLLGLDIPDEAVQQICENMYDLIQSIKTYMLNVPEDFKSLYMVTGLIKKFPQLWKVAKKSFEQGLGQTAIGMQQQQPENSFNIIGNILGPNMMGMSNPMTYNPNQPQMPYQQFQQPMMQQPMYPQQPMMQQQPMGQYAPPPPNYVQQQPMYPQQQNPIGYVDQNQQMYQQQQPMMQQPPQQMTSNVQIPLNNQTAQTSVMVEDVKPVMNPNIQSANTTSTPPVNPNIKK